MSNTWETYVQWANRQRPKSPRMTCECGKEIFTAQHEKHLQTKLHLRMMDKKDRCLKPKTEDKPKVEFTEEQLQEIHRMIIDYVKNKGEFNQSV